MYKRKADKVFKALALACYILWLCLVAVEGFAEPMETRFVAARGGLNVRREPNTSSQKVYTLDETTVVVVLEWKDGWARVANNFPPYYEIGWACGDYLK